MVEPASAASGQPIALGRASRGIRLRTLDPSALQRRIEVVVPKCGTVGQTQCLHQIAAAQLGSSDGTNQGRYLVGYLIAYLVGLHGLAEGILQCSQHELDKWCGICLLVGLGKNPVIRLLAVSACFIHQARISNSWAASRSFSAQASHFSMAS
jgi:hypothetical protein